MVYVSVFRSWDIHEFMLMINENESLEHLWEDLLGVRANVQYFHKCADWAEKDIY